MSRGAQALAAAGTLSFGMIQVANLNSITSPSRTT
jgi:hypothetical protein